MQLFLLVKAPPTDCKTVHTLGEDLHENLGTRMLASGTHTYPEGRKPIYRHDSAAPIIDDPVVLLSSFCIVIHGLISCLHT